MIASAVERHLGNLGDLALLTGRVVRRVRGLRIRDLLYQSMQFGVRSLPLAFAMSVFAGMVLAFQFGYNLQRFGARLFIGQVTVTAIFRELGPILTALVVGGRVAAGIAAELGGMVVTEQVDAVRALGADPVQRLVAPRILAVTLSLPLLAILADVVGTFGAIGIAWVQYDVGPRLFLHGVYDFVSLGDFGSGLCKSLVFGAAIGTVACFEGLRAEGGTEGVGRAATRAVVISGLVSLILDFILTKLLVTL
jgi:phospholipid/cholesterol/gamma-HCH transport system permease protein